MKKILLSLFVVAIAFSTNAQKKAPASPSQKIEQVVGFTTISVDYSRPGVKDRTIFGDLVPFDKVWRTGANASTKITFSKDVMVGDAKLAAGTYALYTVPNEESWDVIFYTDTTNWGTPKEWDEAKVAVKVAAEVMPVPDTIETFTILFDDVKDTSTVLGFLWENTYVGVQIDVTN
ncbi:DUF2911 domain-containing protein [Polaribacter glomeratus]|uniref:Asparagine synthetase B n=1 Tax=Polaribacter glomeratus TaxID=102 RepID=A0A2S7WUR1_9FLAO|nr:DUF2911 domain-containing protein [Polaribacter glomeratus]PQJ81333.1 hypothetical protein BTO16_01500 [Polaribacter glomeratus]TXD64053.1 DUF2911 domain-containing protein [Polaribacter glomeratus]